MYGRLQETHWPAATAEMWAAPDARLPSRTALRFKSDQSNTDDITGPDNDDCT